MQINLCDLGDHGLTRGKAKKVDIGAFAVRRDRLLCSKSTSHLSHQSDLEYSFKLKFTSSHMVLNSTAVKSKISKAFHQNMMFKIS
jgi:hypothetical protein